MAAPSQLLLAQMSNFTCTAYGAYSIISQNYWDNYNNNSIPIITPVQAILSLQPTLTNINPIFVSESGTGGDAAADAKRKSVPEKKIGDSKQALADVAAAYPCGFTVTDGYPDGLQLFGFAATVPASQGLPSENIVALRGTVTDYEGVQSANGWDDAPVEADMPTGGSSSSSIGNIQTNYWSFYSKGGLYGGPLSQSFKQAVAAVIAAQPSLPFYGTAHSLGGAMLSLGILDASLSGIFKNPPSMTTFGSVVAGDENWSKNYTSVTGPQNTFRVANEADFVPSLRGLTPGPALANYTHVGIPLLFVWQTDSDWDNHNLQNIYQPTVSNPSYFKNIYVANKPVSYPVGIVKLGNA